MKINAGCGGPQRELGDKFVMMNSPRKPGRSEWILCKDRLPENTDPVNITWVNHKPARYYADIKDIPFTATGCCCDGKWYWYSATCQDYLDEYGYSGADVVDDEIEVIAWMPLPEPYKEEGENNEDQND